MSGLADMISNTVIILSLCQRLNTRRSKNKVLHTTQDINVTIKSTLLKTFQLPFFIHSLERSIDSATSSFRVYSVLKLVLLCSRDASAPEIVFVDIKKHCEFPFGRKHEKNILEMDSQFTCRRAKSIVYGCLLCETS